MSQSSNTVTAEYYNAQITSILRIHDMGKGLLAGRIDQAINKIRLDQVEDACEELMEISRLLKQPFIIQG